MSDLGRKDLSTKISEGVTPDSEKSYAQKAKESITDTADKVASSVTPDNQKSFSQTLGDSVQKGHDDVKSDVDDNQATIKQTASEYLEAGKKAVNDAAEYVSGVVTGAKEGGESAAKK